MPRARTPKPRAKSRHQRKTKRSRASTDTAGYALLAIADELDIIDQMMGCVPVITMALQTTDIDPAAAPKGSIAHWIRTLRPREQAGSRALKRSAGHVNPAHLRNELLGAPDALGDLARWRLQQVNRLLDALRHSSSKRGR